MNTLFYDSNILLANGFPTMSPLFVWPDDSLSCYFVTLILYEPTILWHNHPTTLSSYDHTLKDQTSLQLYDYNFMTFIFIIILFYDSVIQRFLHTTVCPYLWPKDLMSVDFMALLDDVSVPKLPTILQSYGHRVHKNIIFSLFYCTTLLFYDP